MRGRNFLAIIALIVAVVVVFIAGAFLYLSATVPDLADQVPETPIIVSITQPFNGTVHSMIAPIEVRAQAISQSALDRFVLYADGEFVGVAEAELIGGTASHAKWFWQPPAEGEYLLSVQAVDVTGRVGQSNLLRVTATLENNVVRLEEYLAVEGETLEDVAAQFGVSPEDIQDYNDLPDGVLPADTPISIPQPLPDFEDDSQPDPQTAPEAPAPGESGSGPPPPLLFWFSNLFTPLPVSPPSPPSLQVQIDQCNVSLSIQDLSPDEAGFFVYRFAPNGSGFEQIAALGANNDTGTLSYADSTQYAGKVSYYVSAFNASGEASSQAVTVNVDENACGQEVWTGIRLVDGVLQVDQVVDLAYFYISVQGSQHVRVPAPPDAFLTPGPDGYDASAYLGDINMELNPQGENIKLEAWGWEGGKLVFLGEGEGQINQNNSLIGSVIPWAWTDLKMAQFETFSDVSGEIVEGPIWPTDWEFYWKSGVENTTSGRLQVSLVPFPPEAELNPHGLIVEREVNVGGFFLDLAPIILGEDAAAALQEATEPPVYEQIELFPIPPNPAGPVSIQSIPQFGSVQVNPGNISLGTIPRDFYFRIIPMDGSHIVGPPSNQVIGHYSPPEPPTNPFVDPVKIDPIYEAKIVEFQRPDFPDGNRWGCVVVVGYDETNPLMQSSLAGTIKNTMPLGAEFCPESYKGGSPRGFEALVDDFFSAFETLTNFVSGLYNDIKAFAINLALDVLPCGDVGLEDECREVVAAAVDAGLASVGLPPSLPNFDELKDIAKGEITDLAVEQALAQLPANVPCDALCEELLREAIGQAVETGLDSLSSASIAPGCVSEAEAHEHGREPWCPPSFVIVKPSRGASAQPAVAVVEVTRLPGEVDPGYPSCRLTVGISSSKAFPSQTVWGPYNNSMDIPAQTITIPAYKSFSIDIPEMQPGETKQFLALLDEPLPYQFPWIPELWKNAAGKPDPRDSWFAVVWHGDSTISAEGTITEYLTTEDSQCVLPDSIDFELP